MTIEMRLTGSAAPIPALLQDTGDNDLSQGTVH